MKERPILFSAPMVRALLLGTKTQTRRPVKVQPPAGTLQVSTFHHPEPRPHFYAWTDDGRGRAELAEGGWCRPCPYGAPSDRLWVRESHWWFKDEPDHSCGYYPPKLTREDVEYRADGEKQGRAWRPSIHMPRWASRITLEITDVRVERLQDISDADAIAEGIERGVDFPGWHRGPLPGDSEGLAEAGRAFKVPTAFPTLAYRALWESINGPDSWAANPFVWVVSFRRIDV